MKYTNLNKELKRIGNAVVIAMKKKAGPVGDDIDVKIKDEIILINMPEHAIYVDSGRKKGSMPPPSKLKKWARDKELNEYAVAKSIEKNGIKAKPFLFEFDKITNEEENKLVDAGFEDVVQQTDNMFKQIEEK